MYCKIRFAIIFSLLFLIFASPEVFGDYPDEYPPNSISEFLIGDSTVMTVVNETDLDVIFTTHFRNPYDEYRNLTGRYDIPWIFSHGNSMIFGINESQWFNVPKNTSYIVFYKNTTAFESFVIILKGTHFDAVDKENGNYSISQEFLGYDFPSHSVELRIPLTKNQTKIKVLEIDPIPLYRGKDEDSGFYVVYWKWESSSIPYNQTSALFFVEFTYEPLSFFETPAGEFLIHPWFTMVFGAFLGVLLSFLLLKYGKKRENLEKIISLGIIILVILGLIIIFFIIRNINYSDVAIGIALFSIVIAIGIAVKSKKDMSTIGRSNFLGAVGNYEDARIRFIEIVRKPLLEELPKASNKTKKESIIKHIQHNLEVTTWKSLTYLRQSLVLRKWAEEEDRKSIIEYLKILIENILPWTGKKFDNYVVTEKILRNREVRNVLVMCKLVYNFKEIKNFERELIRLLEPHIGKKTKTETYITYINRKIDETPKSDEEIDKPYIQKK